MKITNRTNTTLVINLSTIPAEVERRVRVVRDGQIIGTKPVAKQVGSSLRLLPKQTSDDLDIKLAAEPHVRALVSAGKISIA